MLSSENPHVVHIGRLVEEAENKMRESLEAIYFAKTREIGDTLRIILPYSVIVVVVCRYFFRNLYNFRFFLVSLSS